MKPYRLINSFELNQFQERFAHALERWNEQYSFYPLSLHVSLLDKDSKITQKSFIESGAYHPIARIDEDYHSLLNYVLFGEDEPSFNATSDELILVLLTQLLSSAPCSFNDQINDSSSWIYPGSTCLLVVFSCEQQQVHCFLNPDWVYHLLAADKRKSLKAVHPLDEALAEESLALNLELNAMKIPFKQLIDLQVGDVLLTDHKINQALPLMQEQRRIASAELGHISEHKSLLLKEFA
jgi:hypothetical protein